MKRPEIAYETILHQQSRIRYSAYHLTGIEGARMNNSC